MELSTKPYRRFIPTPVGNTEVRPAPCRLSAVHPHARGEHGPAHAFIAMRGGSSPRPWGTLVEGLHDGAQHRFIPTPVGNTSRAIWRRHPMPVHPHARGEHSMNAVSSGRKGGSSPRPWGTPDQPAYGLRAQRFIPTPVGNTVCSGCTSPAGAVHPHARGEHPVPAAASGATGGSSPRPWGTHGQHCRQWRGHRFIPTPVGNTRCTSASRPPRAVHPHARGEHTTVQAATRTYIGSSPRPWGTLRPDCCTGT